MRAHYKFWPKRLPHRITPPATSLWDNLAISARRYPDKAALVFFGRVFSYQDVLHKAERLAALFESARAQSRAAGVPVVWHTTATGFVFDGLPASAAPLPTRWLDGQTRALGNAPVVLGPDPIIGAQSVVLQRAGGTTQAQMRVATDGLRPFTVGAP